mmetsp:Transcript_77829/g.241164  ORF Transcript_77829/g.241164 Transcript_77829/m.241164 type:complete len:319 (-) Transcript_77829:16-972(-)
MVDAALTGVLLLLAALPGRALSGGAPLLRPHLRGHDRAELRHSDGGRRVEDHARARGALGGLLVRRLQRLLPLGAVGAGVGVPTEVLLRRRELPLELVRHAARGGVDARALRRLLLHRRHADDQQHRVGAEGREDAADRASVPRVPLLQGAQLVSADDPRLDEVLDVGLGHAVDHHLRLCRALHADGHGSHQGAQQQPDDLGGPAAVRQHPPYRLQPLASDAGWRQLGRGLRRLVDDQSGCLLPLLRLHLLHHAGLLEHHNGRLRGQRCGDRPHSAGLLGQEGGGAQGQVHVGPAGPVQGDGRGRVRDRLPGGGEEVL